MPDEWEMIGFCPVDSGQIMLVDPCYVLADNNTKDEKLNHGHVYYGLKTYGLYLG